MQLTKIEDCYIIYCNKTQIEEIKKAGFVKHARLNQWFTRKPEIAKLYVQYVNPVNQALIKELDEVEAYTIENLKRQMYIDYNFEYHVFTFELDYKIKDIAKDIGFVHDYELRKYITKDINSITIALKKKYRLTREAKEQYKIELEHHNIKVAESLRIHSDLVIPKPDSQEYDYFPHQKVAVEFARDHNYKVLIFDLPRVGKTLSAIGTMNYFPQNNYLITCPVNAVDVWRNHLDDWLVNRDEYTVHHLYKLKTFPEINSKKNIFIITYGMLFKYVNELKKFNFNIVIADEVHKVRTKKTRQGKSFFTIVSKIPYKLYLSGTLINKYLAEFYNILNDIGFSDAQNWYRYMKKYCNDGYGNHGSKFSSNVEELNTNLRKEVMIRRTRAEVFPDTPDKIRSVYRPTFLEEDIAEITKLQELEFESIKNMDSTYSPEIGEMARLRKTLAIKKIPYTIEFAKTLLEDTSKIIIFAYHREAQEQIYQALLEFKPVRITGESTPEQRGQAEFTFQNDPDCRVAVLSLKGASEAITMSKAESIVMHETFWTPDVMQQAEDRGYGHDKTESVMVYYLVAEGTVDAYVAQMMVHRMDLIDKAINTPQGFSSEEVKQILSLQKKSLTAQEILEKMLVA